MVNLHGHWPGYCTWQPSPMTTPSRGLPNPGPEDAPGAEYLSAQPRRRRGRRLHSMSSCPARRPRRSMSFRRLGGDATRAAHRPGWPRLPPQSKQPGSLRRSPPTQRNRPAGTPTRPSRPGGLHGHLVGPHLRHPKPARRAKRNQGPVQPLSPVEGVG